MDMLDEIRKKFDLSILMTTHDFTMLEQYCDPQVVLCCRERSSGAGSPLDVLNSEEFGARHSTWEEAHRHERLVRVFERTRHPDV